MTTLVNNQS